ncbi:MAG: fibronectin type III domain-containing protein [Oscillospiraceae bacterium]|nr:fibronectin type III domain-containing protein [Oscillospiraceae bacterium]
MKKLSLKKLSCLLLVLICAVTCISMPDVDASAKVVKPSKVVISALKRYNKSTVGLSWKAASRAKGYQVYMKTNGGGYKKILTTSGRYLKKSGLKINSSYYFKVRAYTKYKGKTYYGAFSNVRKIKMTSYVFLVDVIEPYAKSCYYAYQGAGSLYMGGKPYYKSFCIYQNGYATFNFQGKYSKISFYYGGKDGGDRDMTAMFYEDGELVRTLSRTKDSLPKYYSIDLSNTYQFKVETYTGSTWNGNGFGNVKLYY